LQQSELLLTGRALLLDLVEPRSKMAAMVLDPSPAFLQLRERNRCCLIRVDQTLDFTIQPPELPLDPRAFVLTGAVSREIAAALLEVAGQIRTVRYVENLPESGETAADQERR
jgi:hypothetical protein